MDQHIVDSRPRVGAAVGGLAEELAAHERTYDGFTVFATGVTVHLAILLSALALAFFGNAPVMATLWFVVAHVGLIVLLVRLAHAPRRTVGPPSPVVVPIHR